jgi:hypothetical protein
MPGVFIYVEQEVLAMAHTLPLVWPKSQFFSICNSLPKNMKTQPFKGESNFYL